KVFRGLALGEQFLALGQPQRDALRLMSRPRQAALQDHGGGEPCGGGGGGRRDERGAPRGGALDTPPPSGRKYGDGPTGNDQRRWGQWTEPPWNSSCGKPKSVSIAKSRRSPGSARSSPR